MVDVIVFDRVEWRSDQAQYTLTYPWALASPSYLRCYSSRFAAVSAVISVQHNCAKFRRRVSEHS